MKYSNATCLCVLVLLVLSSTPLNTTVIHLSATSEKLPTPKTEFILQESHLEPYINNYDYSYSHENIQWAGLGSGLSQSMDLEIGSTDNLMENTLSDDEKVRYTINSFDENTITKCPTGLTLYTTKQNETLCFKITKPSEFPPSCPYPYQINYYNFKNTNDLELTDNVVWALIQKNKINNNFEWMYSISNDTIDIRKIYQENPEQDCFVINGTMLMPVNCDQKYHGICIYSMDLSLNDDYCKRKLNETCFSNNLGVLSKCYCINRDIYSKSRDSYCAKLADITDPYQNSLISKRLKENEFCWFALEKIKWMSAEDSEKYSYWSTNNNTSKKFGAVGKRGWILEDEEALSCGLCEVNIDDLQEVQLHLKRNFSNHKIQLEIYNGLNAFEGVLCMTGNDSHFINLSTTKDNYLLQDLWLFDDIKDYCWCKTLQLPNLEKVYSNKIIASNINLHEHVFVAIWTFSMVDKAINFSTRSCPELKSEIILHSKLIQTTFFNDKLQIQHVCHYYTDKSNLTRRQEYQILEQTLNISNVILEKFSNAVMCLTTTTTSGNKTLHWHETPIGATIAAEELCFQENGEPVTRTCGGNYTFGAEWLPVNGSCVESTIPPTTMFLNDLLLKKTSNVRICSELARVTEDKNSIDSYQIHLVSQLLGKVTDENSNVILKDVVTTVNNIMQVDENKLKKSQVSLNSTDIILSNFDNILNRLDDTVNEIGYISESSNKVLTQAVSLIKTNIKGFQLQSSGEDVFNVSNLKLLHQYTENDVLEDNLDLALLIPNDLHDSIVQCHGSKLKPTIITSMFYDDSLFIEYGIATGKPNGKILSVLVPGFNCTFSRPIQVIFKSSVNESFEETCASWVYGSNSLMESIHGHWSTEQKPKILGNMSQYRLCEYSHVTHFALLVLGENSNISSANKKALDIITAIGSGLSVIGLMGVFITAIIFKVYRETNGIVINFSIAMTAQIVLLFVADNVSDNKVACTVFGALLHYIVLAQFLWMLAIAVLQYQRYVVIFSNPPSHVVIKTSLFAWGIPLIPVIIIVSISTDNYGKNVNGLCYAVGQYFSFGVLVPVALIIIVNVMIFLRIMISVAGSRRIKVHRDKSYTSKLQLRLAFMLFFLLGLTWGFGLLASIGGSVVYSYLFCITATVQGFVLFLFFIVLNEKTRMLWINLKTCCSKHDEYDINRDSAASVMMRKTKTSSTGNSTNSATSEILRKVKNRGSSEF
ncbi:hypothetical protein FQR65_LT09687 [Abscondita terminalis]|nr:hypothetical protein FQR65_LT09687 [Abscondita terminalis]